jgi:hypothetical protein
MSVEPSFCARASVLFNKSALDLRGAWGAVEGTGIAFHEAEPGLQYFEAKFDSQDYPVQKEPNSCQHCKDFRRLACFVFRKSNRVVDTAKGGGDENEVVFFRMFLAVISG